MPIVRIICLSNVHDEHYHDLRSEPVARILSAPKRLELFRCLQMATGGEVLILSSPPPAIHRRSARWLPAVRTVFGTLPQFFCCNWDVPKLRIPLSWIFYARHVLRHARNGDIVLIDNYELIYVLAAYWVRLFRRVTFILDYEDGKHLIDRSWSRIFSGIAEWLGRRLIKGALLVHPAMKSRLDADLPTVLVPGFISGPDDPEDLGHAGEIRFLYSGTLDTTRGVDLVLNALEKLPDRGWRLDITGSGPLAASVEAAATRIGSKVKFHGTLADGPFRQLVASTQVGLNCQRASDPISTVTFPSKIFSYLSAGLLVLSSTAGAAKEICGDACVYFHEETPDSLAAAMIEIIRDPNDIKRHLNLKKTQTFYSPKGTALRLREFLKALDPSVLLNPDVSENLI